VETWAKKFHETPREQRVPFLYLANDILQNSRRKGPEFVNEFWTVLPRVLREVVDSSGDESVKNAAYRLVRVAD
jgi:regulator of Ty1 transposition protein 103